MSATSSPGPVGPGDDAFAVCMTAISRATATMRLEAAADTAPDLPFSCADLSAAAARGEDPTKDWRQEYAAQTAAFSGACPPGMDLTFVLLFYCDVLATPATSAAALGPWVLDVSPSAVSFDLARPWTHPGRVRLRRGGFAVVGEPGERHDRARRAYEEHALPFAAAYAPGSRLSSHARRGLVADAWAVAWARATGGPAPERETCCLIYALPGAHECAGCPRLCAT